MAVLEDAVIFGYIQHSVDMMKIFNAWETVATLQILLKGYGTFNAYKI